MDKAPLVIYHADCADGWTAAWVAHRAFARQGVVPELVRGVYGKPPADVAGREVYMLDFTYPKADIIRMAESAKSVQVLDHHETAWKEWGEMSEGREGLVYANDNLGLTFRRDQSGAMVTWNHFNPNQEDSEVLSLVRYVQDRDLWLFKMPRSREINAWIFAHEYTLDNWERLSIQLSDQRSGLFDMAVLRGGAIEKKHFKDIREFLAIARTDIALDGQVVPCVNAPYHWSSDAAHILAEGRPFAAAWFDRGDGMRVFSLRSSESGLDVGAVAKKYGGGGHRHAAGFAQPSALGMSPAIKTQP